MNLDSGVLQVPLEDIIPNRFQPRLNFDEQGLKELADSIKEHGIIQPLVLRKLGDKYEIIAGERRYKAAGMAGLQTVPAVVANIDDNKSAEVALVENVQRRDLTAIEEARSYKSLLDKGYLTQEQLAKRMGLSQPSIANKLRLLNLDEEVQQALLEEKISERHARTLLQLPDKAAQREWLHRIINERMTVRQLDLELKNLTGNTEVLDSEPEDVPVVSAQPSLEEMKAGAMDLREARQMPQSTLETSQDNFNMFNTNLTANENNTIKTATTVPDFNVTTPDNNGFVAASDVTNNNFKSDYLGTIPTYPSNMENNPNRFNPLPDAPKPDNSFFNANNDFNTNPNAGGLEVFDDPSSPSQFIEVKEEPKKETAINTFNNNESTYTGSSSNKFFTPIVEDRPNTFIAPTEQDVNPMDRINNLRPDVVEEKQKKKEMGLIDAIEQIRSTIQDLGENGFFIEVEEIDFPNNYQITVQIHKDN